MIFTSLKRKLILGSKYILSFFIKKPNILDSNKTVDLILKEKLSVVRFGDGEIDLIQGRNLDFQSYSKEIANDLKSIKMDDNLLICLPKALFYKNTNLKDSAAIFWKKHYLRNGYFWKKHFKNKGVYGDASFTRFYIDYKNFDNNEYIDKLKMIWDHKNIIIIEGSKTKFGINNDLLSNCQSIKRIICPSSNAYEKKQEIENFVIKNCDKDDLLLIALGPTATVLSYELSRQGYQAIDIGHLDIEYEWFLNKAKAKVIVPGKFVNETNTKFIASNLVTLEGEDILYDFSK